MVSLFGSVNRLRTGCMLVIRGFGGGRSREISSVGDVGGDDEAMSEDVVANSGVAGEDTLGP